jgi:hypothetical protein
MWGLSSGTGATIQSLSASELEATVAVYVGV